MNGTTLLMHKGAVDVSGSHTDDTHIGLQCGGYMTVEESPIEGLKILPSGNIQISGKTFNLTE